MSHAIAAPFSEAFQKRLDDIERRALRAKTNLTAVCKALNISRSTPDRWRRKVPRTIEIIEQMEQFVSEAEKRQDARPAHTPVTA
jgi:hypothetical protein